MGAVRPRHRQSPQGIGAARMTWKLWRTIFRASPREEADSEIAFHIEERTRELIAEGEDPARARQLTEQRFGPIAPIERAIEDSTRRRRERAERTEVVMHLTQ